MTSERGHPEAARGGRAALSGPPTRPRPRIADSAAQAIGELKAEGERQRAEAGEALQAAHRSLTEAADQTRLLAQTKMREDVERMLDDLLREIRKIGADPDPA